MTKQSYYRKMFLFSAAFNLILAGSALVLQFGQLDFSSPLPVGWAFPVGYLCFVFIFGIGYYWLAQDLDSNHGIVSLGILGKVSVFLIFSVDYIWGAGDLTPTLLGCVDLLFAFLFLDFLSSYKSHQAVFIN